MEKSSDTPTVRRHSNVTRVAPTVCLNPRPERRADSLTSLCRELGPCVYFIRTDDGLIKIGHTEHLDVRKRAYGSGWDRILAVTAGTRADEAALHERFAPHRARGQEFYRPAPELVEHVNSIRTRLGVPRI